MSALIVLIGAIIYLVSYFTYGKALEKNVVKVDTKRETPAVRLRDNVDYIPANKFVLFGHHFASIAGAGPIAGPAIAMVWGWLPSILWVWFGNLFIGSVHDYLSLMASVRYDGKSIQWVAGKIMGERTKTVFELYVLFAMILVIAAFMATFTSLASKSPQILTGTVLFIVIAFIEGLILYKTKMPFSLATVLGVIMLVLVIFISFKWPFISITNVHTLYLLQFIYIVFAAALPVWILLQPRDYLNSFLLYAGLALGLVGAIISFRGFSWPAFTTFSARAVGGQPSPFWPTVPLVIACGALSGFHSIVGSGTSSKQLDKEISGLFVGYGAMFTEGFLSTIVITSIGAFGLEVLQSAAAKVTELGVDMAQLTAGGAYLGNTYVKAANAVGGTLAVFTKSYGLMLNKALTIPAAFGATFAGLWVSAFVMTTLDTTNRLGRYAWTELWEPVKKASTGLYAFLTNRWVASIVVAAIGLWLAWGNTYTVLWAGFAGTNQLLASIAMLTAAVWVKNVQKAGKWATAVVIPALFLWITVFVSLVWYLIKVVPTLAAATKVPMYIFTIVMLILDLVLVAQFFISYRKGPELEASKS
jgi:carbon starvation protein